MRRALQISDGEISGLFNTAFSITIYAIIALLVLWPLINFVVRRLRPPKHELHAGHSHALVELAEELIEEEEARREPEPALSGRHSPDGADAGAGPADDARRSSGDDPPREKQ
jgi:hypothetical protein